MRDEEEKSAERIIEPGSAATLQSKGRASMRHQPATVEHKIVESTTKVVQEEMKKQIVDMEQRQAQTLNALMSEMRE